MNEGKESQKSLIDTTDCLEAIGVFKVCKNILFFLAIISLVMLQISFWIINFGRFRIEEKTVKVSETVVLEKPLVAEQATVEKIETKKDEIEKAAEQITSDTNVVTAKKTEPVKQQKQISIFDFYTKPRAVRVIRFFNFVLFFAAILHCMTMLFSLKISLLGRLGGINHISRAFFLSLLFLVFLLPWQRFFGGIPYGPYGVMYVPTELFNRVATISDANIFGKFFYYLRFTGFWLFVVLLLISSQIRSARWAKAILRRLEII